MAVRGLGFLYNGRDLFLTPAEIYRRIKSKMPLDIQVTWPQYEDINKGSVMILLLWAIADIIREELDNQHNLFISTDQ